MRDVAPGEYSPEQVQRMVQGIPFFNEILRNDPGQFEALMGWSRLLHADAGDVVIRRGDNDPRLYFVLKGQLVVLAGDAGSAILNTVGSGQPVGILSMVRATPRSATLVADPQGKGAVLLALDHDAFRDLADHSRFTLASKLSFHKMVVNDIRWTLEMNRKSDPDSPHAQAMRRVPLYTGPKGTADELASLKEQAAALGEILCQWNDSVPRRPA